MEPISVLNHRNEFGAWLQRNGVTGTGVEVGSLCGEYAREILKTWTSGVLIMIDPWEKQPDHVYQDLTNGSDWDAAYKSCLLVQKDFPDRCHLHRAYSPAAASHYADGGLAFAYLDARHDLASINADLSVWHPKVRSGGILCGHDFYLQIDATKVCQVQEAVEKFCADRGLAFHVSRGEGCYSWWIQL